MPYGAEHAYETKPQFTEQALNPRRHAVAGRYVRHSRTRSAGGRQREYQFPVPHEEFYADRQAGFEDRAARLSAIGEGGGEAKGYDAPSASGQFGLLGSAVEKEAIGQLTSGLAQPGLAGIQTGLMAQKLGDIYSIPASPVEYGIKGAAQAFSSPAYLGKQFGSMLGTTLAADEARAMAEDMMDEGVSPEMAELEALNAFQQSSTGLPGLGKKAASGLMSMIGVDPQDAFGGLFAEPESLQSQFEAELAMSPDEYGPAYGPEEFGMDYLGVSPQQLQAATQFQQMYTPQFASPFQQQRDKMTEALDPDYARAYNQAIRMGYNKQKAKEYALDKAYSASQSAEEEARAATATAYGITEPALREHAQPVSGAPEAGTGSEGVDVSPAPGGVEGDRVGGKATGYDPEKEGTGDQDSDSEGTVLCTALYMQGMLPKHIYYADSAFGETVNKHVFRAYQIIAGPIARLMIKRKTVAKLVRPIVSKFAYYFAARMGVK